MRASIKKKNFLFTENTILISIITVVFNDVKNIESTIQSVINQTYKNIEYIVIDGGSTDGTKNIIKKYKKYLAYYISEEDQGIYDAMNKGISLASGKWINFLNSGDTLANEKIIDKIPFNKYQSYSLIYGNTKIFNVERKFIKILKALKMNRVNLLLFGTRVACHQSIFYNNKIKFKYPKKYKLKGELFSYFQFIKYKVPIYVDLIISNYYLGGIGSIHNTQNKIEALDILKKEFKFLWFLNYPSRFYSYLKKVF